MRHENRIQSAFFEELELIMSKLDLEKYDNKTLWVLIGDLDKLSESNNKDFWMNIGAEIRREINKRLQRDFEM